MAKANGGLEKTQESYRLFLVTALAQWVEHGAPPAQFVGTKFTDNGARPGPVPYARPVRLSPAVARYKGTGDPNDVTNFACVK